MNENIKSFQVHVPFRLLMTQNTLTVIKERINPEISFNGNDLDTLKKSRVADTAKRLSDAGLTVTFHAPFMDLRPGAIDPKVRQATRERLKQVFDLVPYFQPLRVVCHPSFDARYYVSNQQTWLANSIETWGYCLKMAEDMKTVISLENVYETDPAALEQLLGHFNSPHLGFCFDVGHFNVFSRVPLETWLAKLTPYLGQLHLHDNDGAADDHAPIGQGTFPFQQLFSKLRESNLSPIITLEAHSEDDLRQTILNIKKMNLLGGS